MFAIIYGLNSLSIRRLKRTSDHVDSKYMRKLETCENMTDSRKIFSNYRSTLATVNPPCLPFIKVYLIDVTCIHDGSKDYLQPNVINFRKCQKTAKVIREIKHWQSK
ncbi:ras GEF [Rickenella mellea]|uniref:Ras GEF n=1 Tax=Rickenella mellea TaxID=50990 RepID=A0A4Y7PDA6_9AGAM|nr:ras GEF [Rickenella mellea]